MHICMHQRLQKHHRQGWTHVDTTRLPWINSTLSLTKYTPVLFPLTYSAGFILQPWHLAHCLWLQYLLSTSCPWIPLGLPFNHPEISQKHPKTTLVSALQGTCPETNASALVVELNRRKWDASRPIEDATDPLPDPLVGQQNATTRHSWNSMSKYVSYVEDELSCWM